MMGVEWSGPTGVIGPLRGTTASKVKYYILCREEVDVLRQSEGRMENGEWKWKWKWKKKGDDNDEGQEDVCIFGLAVERDGGVRLSGERRRKG